MTNTKMILSAASIFVFCVALAPLTTQAQRWGSGPVIVYDGRDGRGDDHSFSVGVFRNDRNELGSLRNDAAASVTIPQGYRVRFCDSEGRGQGSGRCEEFGPGNHNMRYPNTASYIQVWGPSGSGWGGGWGGGQGTGQQGVTVFEDRDFRGRTQSFGVGIFMNAGGRFGQLRNDSASSVIVTRGYRVRFCEDEGPNGRGSGRCEEYSEGRHNLRYNDEASFIEVQRGWGGGNWGGGGIGPGPGPGPYPGPFYGNAPVIVFGDRNQGGDQQAFNVGVFRNDLNQLGQLRNDDAGSVYVSRGYRVRLCDSEGGGRGTGRCEEYGQGTHNLRYNDKASFIRVWRGRF